MSEIFIQAITTLGTTPEDEVSMLESRLYPKLNTEVGMTMTKTKLVFYADIHRMLVCNLYITL
mgnify:CR=1 FL=1